MFILDVCAYISGKSTLNNMHVEKLKKFDMLYLIFTIIKKKSTRMNIYIYIYIYTSFKQF